ncbi:class I SAM-dependent methyltransferase [Salipiger profundus]|uniref:class I SAM-dependent methyltransferase n=1 Tax=Salipiger profundus TaxID=1229727 RepID=UPI0008E05B47|nr:class I SAM-dependent methyltransferase [Salipiger profundus]SFD77337.1 Methyltransferase domain-containing protein [Salipiger profundus]
MHPDQTRQAEFWNKRASGFPAGRSAQHRERLLSRLAHVPQKAWPGQGQRCLDIGAGTGVFSIFAAERGAGAMALDVSSGMLDELRGAAGKLPIQTMETAWQTVDPDALGWRNSFDTVFAQMVPGVRSVEDFERMEVCSRGWCVYIGWGRKRQDAWLEAAFALHDVPWSVPLGVPLALECLNCMGRHPEPVWREESWKRDRPARVAVQDAVGHLSVRGVTADTARLEALAREFQEKDGHIRDAAEVEIGVLSWAP